MSPIQHCFVTTTKHLRLFYNLKCTSALLNSLKHICRNGKIVLLCNLLCFNIIRTQEWVSVPAKVSMTSFNCLAVSQLQTIFTPFHKYNKATMQIYGTRKNINNSYTLFALSQLCQCFNLLMQLHLAFYQYMILNSIFELLNFRPICIYNFRTLELFIYINEMIKSSKIIYTNRSKVQEFKNRVQTLQFLKC